MFQNVIQAIRQDIFIGDNGDKGWMYEAQLITVGLGNVVK
jgi:hypothetical protein